jgi:sialidase-1
MKKLESAMIILTLSGLSLTSCQRAAQGPIETSLSVFLGEPQFSMQPVFTDERFPNIVVTRAGTVLATWGSKRVRARRSEDGGHTWGPEIVIAKGLQGGGTTVDETTGDILAFVEESHPPGPFAVYRSRDDGKTWQKQQTAFHPDSQGHDACMHMNEHGITLQYGKHQGRLLRASRYYGKRNDRSEWPTHYTNAVYSDDGGHTWHASDPFPEMGTGEATIAELSDGRLYYNARVHWDQRPKNTRRRCAFSDDGGQTWEHWQIIDALPDGQQQRSYGCMGGLTRLPIAGRDILIFSNIDTPNATRERATVWASLDGGQTWPVKRLVYQGRSAYSSLTAGRPDTDSAGWIYLHFEGGPDKGSQVARFNLAWLLAGEPTGDGALPKELSQ